ncbi:hypothetical protein KL911_003603 [Ogataea haglerorum]|uniref:uncharacterized protein n=1 Tax=Ogataea haglerorum TaxID=1937702 RepID=UPI001C89D707|nr:uncharacterized protein KL911_003603 [Ogataea haglerorum]KAG7752872.1 hypothetical protein KL911_003603 [Ogataea haglerorum]
MLLSPLLQMLLKTWLCALLLASFPADCQPVPQNLSTPSPKSVSTSWDLSRIISRHQPKGIPLNDEDVFVFLDKLASFLQITNCDNKHGGLKLPSEAGPTSLQFPPKLEQFTKIPNNTTDVEIVKQLNAKKPASKLDWMQYLLNGKGMLFLDHHYRKIVVSIRSDLELKDYFAIYSEKAISFWPQVYQEGFWKSVKKKVDPGMTQHPYTYYRSQYWGYYWRNYFKLNKVHSGYFNIADRMFEDIFVEYLKAKQQYPDYQLVIAGHSMGGSIASIISLNFHLVQIANLLVTFNSPKLWSESLANMYDRVSGTTRIRDVNMGLESGYLRLWNTRDAWNLFPPGSLLSTVLSTAFKHSGLSLATEQNKLDMAMRDLVVEYDLLGKWDYEMEHKHCKFIKSTDEFVNVMSWDAHRVLLRDIWACVDLKP